MAVDRPTFDESWHRVANLRPRLRSIVQVHRQAYRGQIWHVYRDPGNNQYFRLHHAAHFFVGLLDGTRTVGEAWAIATDRLGDAAPTQGEAIRTLGMLYTSNLLHGELPPDATGLLDRYRQRRQREVRGYLMNILFAKIPLLDPERVLQWLAPLLGWIFSVPGVILWAVLIGCGLWALAGHERELWDAGGGVLGPQNLVYLYLCFGLLKLIHESGHGLACKAMARHERGDGEVHEMGVMLLVLMPIPYVNATSAWSFRSKWRRLVVSAAGMYVELAVAAVAALIWTRTAEGTLTHALAYNVMFVASVTTVLFNANPLIRFDGYYMLSDLIEVPNLYQRSQNYLKYLIKTYVYGVRRTENPAHVLSERLWFTAYGVASLIYRVFLFFGIFLFVADKLFFIGTIMALWGIVGYVVVPMGKLLHYLAVGPELVRTRVRAGLATAGFAAVALAVTGAVPWEDYGRSTGVVEPRRLAQVSLGEDGFITEVQPSDVAVAPGGPPLIAARNIDLEAERARLEGLVAELDVERQQAMSEDPGQGLILAEKLDGARSQLWRVESRLDALTVRPTIVGQWIVAEPDRLRDTWQPRGTPIGAVASLDDLVIRLAVDQYLGPRLHDEVLVGTLVEIRVEGQPGVTFRGRLEAVLPAGSEQLPARSLSQVAGGTLATEQDERQGERTAEPFFEVRLDVDEDQYDHVQLLPGQRVVARFPLPDRPLLSQAYLALRQLLQQRFQI